MNRIKGQKPLGFKTLNYTIKSAQKGKKGA